MTRLLPLTVPLLGATVLFVGCGGRHNPNEKYYLVANNVKLSYWQSAGNGLVHAATEMGVQSEMVGPDTFDPQAEAAAFRDAAAKKPAGILVSVADPAVLGPVIDNAIAQGIPVITMDSDAPKSKRLSFVGTNNYEAGRTGAGVVIKQTGGKGEVLVFTMPEQPNLAERLHGYKDVFADHPGMHIAQVVDIKGDPRIAFDAVMQMVNTGKPKVDAFVCLEATACKEVADVLNRNNVKGKTIVAMDTDQETLEWVKKGSVAATIAQKPFTMAFYGAKMLDDLHHYPPKSLDHDWATDTVSPVPVFVDTGTTLIDNSNLDAFTQAQTSVKGQ